MRKKLLTVFLLTVGTCIFLTGCGKGQRELKKGKEALYGTEKTEVNYETAYHEFTAALEKENAEANLYLGLMADWYSYPENDYGKAMQYYKENKENPYAKICMGYMYLNGQGVTPDREIANALFQEAIDENCQEAYIGKAAVAEMEGDYATAMEAYNKVLKGTEQVFCASAMQSIAGLYYDGNGVDQDFTKAMEWYAKAAELGDTTAMNNIGYMYQMGEGVECDYDKALEYYDQAIKCGSEPAKSNADFLRNKMKLAQ